MILASLRPNCSAVIVAGAPLAYWAAPRQIPDALFGGLLGGKLAAAAQPVTSAAASSMVLAGAEFENRIRRTRCGSKQYNVFSKVEQPRPIANLEFERWWGGHVNLNAEEIQFIVR